MGTFTTNQRNGADFISTLMFRLAMASEIAFLGVSAAILIAVGYLYLRMRRKEHFQLRKVWVVLVESSVYALLMGIVIVFIMTKILGMSPPSLAAAKAALDPWMVIYISAGAGVHEELVFRVLLFGGLLAGFARYTRFSRLVGLTLALGISSVLFSISHHIPPHGEAFAMFPFVYRIFAGGIFGLLYVYRGFSVAVYTHFLYDVLVLGVLAG